MARFDELRRRQTAGNGAQEQNTGMPMNPMEQSTPPAAQQPDSGMQGQIGGAAPMMQAGRYASDRAVPMMPAAGIASDRAVRTGEEEAAYNQSQRMNAENAIGRPGFGAGMSMMKPGEEPGITPEKLRKAERTLMRYKAGKSSVEQRIISAQLWWKLRNWQQIQAKDGVIGVSGNKHGTAWLWNCIVGKHADMMDNYPEPIILPRMQDDKQEAEKLSEILPVVLEINGFEETYSECQWQKLQEGTGAYGVFWDKTKLNGLGDISIRKINLLNLFWEPGITDIQESRELFYVTLVDNEQLEGMYPQLEGKLKNSTISVAKYRADDNVSTEDKSAVIDWYYHKYDGTKKVLHYCKFVGEEILYSTENNGEMKGLYDDGMYPFVLDPLYPVESSPAGYGYVDIGKGAQTDIDVLNQAMVLNAACNATPRYFIRKDGSVNEDEFADFSKPFVHVGGQLGQDSILPITPAQMSGNCFNMLQQKIDELKFVTGNTDVNNGGVPSGVTAASAIAALKEDSGRSSKDSTKASYRAYRRIINMVIERIRQFYDIPRQFRILGERAQELFVEYDNSGLTPQLMPGGLGMEDSYRLPVFDIDVRAQRENAYTKMSQNELALQLYQQGLFNPQATDQALMTLDMMEFRGKDEVMKKVEQQGTLIQALSQIGQIALQLAQTYQPEVAPQLAMTLQGIVGEMGGAAAMPSIGGGKPNAALNAATRAQDATAKAADPNESGIVRNARERAANATRPD